MSIRPEFEDVEEVNLLLRLLSDEQASLVGRQVLVKRRIDAGPDSCTSRQWERATRAHRALPEQIQTVENVQEMLKLAMAEARHRGMEI